MRILIVWGNRQPIKETRNTILDYIFSFQKYDTNNTYYYLNLIDGTERWDFSWIKEGMFDVVLFTCTFLGIRWRTSNYSIMWDMCERVFGPLSCRKVLMPQDEYDNTAKLWDFINRVGINDIYSVLPESDHSILYPSEKIGNRKIKTILTGYVEERYLEWQFPPKTIDVIYRANSLPYKFGRLGQQKTDIIDHFVPKLTNLKTDIKNTVSNKDIYVGNAWIEHLAGARCVLGCISGSSIMDADGEIGRGFDEYLRIHPTATYSEAKEACFPDLAENLKGAIGPRHLESAITRTCQVLIRDDYNGILKEDIDYIPVDPDYGNIDEVVKKINDKTYCSEIADNCYRNVIESKKYTYQTLVREVMGNDRNEDDSIKNSRQDRLIQRKCNEHNRKVDVYNMLLRTYGNIRSTMARS